jgi:hypothetical protein
VAEKWYFGEDFSQNDTQNNAKWAHDWNIPPLIMRISGPDGEEDDWKPMQ